MPSHSAIATDAPEGSSLSVEVDDSYSSGTEEEEEEEEGLPGAAIAIIAIIGFIGLLVAVVAVVYRLRDRSTSEKFVIESIRSDTNLDEPDSLVIRFSDDFQNENARTVYNQIGTVSMQASMQTGIQEHVLPNVDTEQQNLARKSRETNCAPRRKKKKQTRSKNKKKESQSNKDELPQSRQKTITTMQANELVEMLFPGLEKKKKKAMNKIESCASPNKDILVPTRTAKRRVRKKRKRKKPANILESPI